MLAAMTETDSPALLELVSTLEHPCNTGAGATVMEIDDLNLSVYVFDDGSKPRHSHWCSHSLLHWTSLIWPWPSNRTTLRRRVNLFIRWTSPQCSMPSQFMSSFHFMLASFSPVNCPKLLLHSLIRPLLQWDDKPVWPPHFSLNVSSLKLQFYEQSLPIASPLDRKLSDHTAMGCNFPYNLSILHRFI